MGLMEMNQWPACYVWPCLILFLNHYPLLGPCKQSSTFLKWIKHSFKRYICKTFLFLILFLCDPAGDTLTFWDLHGLKNTAARHKTPRKKLQQRVWNWNAHKREFSDATWSCEIALSCSNARSANSRDKPTQNWLKKNLSLWVIFGFTRFICHYVWLS